MEVRFKEGDIFVNKEGPDLYFRKVIRIIDNKCLIYNYNSNRGSLWPLDFNYHRLATRAEIVLYSNTPIRPFKTRFRVGDIIKSIKNNKFLIINVERNPFYEGNKRKAPLVYKVLNIVNKKIYYIKRKNTKNYKLYNRNISPF